MEIIKRFKARIKGKPYFKKEPNYTPIFAFECEGKRIYQPSDASQIPAMRALMAHRIYTQLNRGVTDENLEIHCKLMFSILNKPSLNVQDIINIKEVYNRLEDARHIPFDDDLLLDLACVVFVQEGENPYDFEKVVQDEKKAMFRRHPELVDFFYKHPLIDLIPSSMESEVDTEDYLRAAKKVKEAYTKKISEMTLKYSPKVQSVKK